MEHFFPFVEEKIQQWNINIIFLATDLAGQNKARDWAKNRDNIVFGTENLCGKDAFFGAKVVVCDQVALTLPDYFIGIETSTFSVHVKRYRRFLGFKKAGELFKRDWEPS